MSPLMLTTCCHNRHPRVLKLPRATISHHRRHAAGVESRPPKRVSPIMGAPATEVSPQLVLASGLRPEINCRHAIQRALFVTETTLKRVIEGAPLIGSSIFPSTEP